MTEERAPYEVPNEERSVRWEFVRNREGRATNVRCLRGTTIIEVLHRGEKILVDVAEMKAIGTGVKDAIDIAQKCVYNGT